MTNLDEAIGSVHLLRLQPGDILALTTPVDLTQEQAEQLHQKLMKIVPEGVKAIVLSGGASLTVVRSGDELPGGD